MNDPANFCPWPCPNPVAYAATHGQPPDPPPLRSSWPELPGFPADLQPPSNTTQVAKRQAAGNMTGLPGRNLLYPAYQINNTDGNLTANTIWPDLVSYGGYVHYDLHNLFAQGMITATRNSLLDRTPGVRPFIISRSTSSGSGNSTGHWTGRLPVPVLSVVADADTRRQCIAVGPLPHLHPAEYGVRLYLPNPDRGRRRLWLQPQHDRDALCKMVRTCP